MSLTKEKVIALHVSAATDNGQSPSTDIKPSIPEEQPKINENLEVSDPDTLHTVTLTEMYETAYAPRANIVDNFLCAGTYLFVGGPKVGKSFFMAQLGYHVSAGLSLWENAVHPSTVLYLALEDPIVRLQKRLSMMFGVSSADNYHIATQAKTLRDGLDKQLDNFMGKHPDTKLIIVDTLQKVREVGGESYSYANDYEIVTKLKKFSDKYNICILAVHHTRKMSAEDVFDTISGTNGLLGAADGAYLMHKSKRTDREAVLEIVGRDQQDQRLHLSFHQERWIWELTSSETELWKEPPNLLLEAVARLLSPEVPEWSGTASDLMDRLDGIDVQPNVLTRRLNVGADRLWNEYSIHIETKRTHAGRCITLTLSTEA